MLVLQLKDGSCCQPKLSHMNTAEMSFIRDQATCRTDIWTALATLQLGFARIKYLHASSLRLFVSCTTGVSTYTDAIRHLPLAGPNLLFTSACIHLWQGLHHLNVLCGCWQYDVHVTAGANQAFANVVLALLDPEDACVLFAPYYFNHMMALQLAGGAENVVTGRCHPTSWHPDLDWLQAALASPNPPRMFVITNPCNPTGILMLEASC